MKENNHSEEPMNRKTFLQKATVFTIAGAFAGQGFMFLRSLAPNVLYEPLKRFRIGFTAAFSEGVSFNSEGRLFVIKKGNEYKSVSAVCTHLGCTVNLHKLSEPQTVKVAGGKELVQEWESHCPCHGSKFRADGTAYAGPAPADLPHWPLGLAPDGQLLVDTGKSTEKDVVFKTA
jgi:cytochrome b6-f complex iron-sulfur subunit